VTPNFSHYKVSDLLFHEYVRAHCTIGHVWISITQKRDGPPRKFLQVLYRVMTSMRGVHKTSDALHRFWVVSAWIRRAVYVRAHYTGEHVWLSISKRKAPPPISLQSLYTLTSTTRRFRANHQALYHLWVGSLRKREIQQKSHFRPSLEGSRIFWGTKFKNRSLPFYATVIPLRMCRKAGPYYATRVHAFVSSEAHNTKKAKILRYLGSPPGGLEGASRLWHDNLLAPWTVHLA